MVVALVVLVEQVVHILVVVRVVLVEQVVRILVVVQVELLVLVVRILVVELVAHKLVVQVVVAQKQDPAVFTTLGKKLANTKSRR